MAGLILGTVLAGGQSRRFGRDKARAMFDGRTLIEHAVALLAPFATRTVICGGTRDGYETVADRPAPGLGPLGGLAAALHMAAATGMDGVLTIPCDTPLLPPAALRRLLDAGGPAMLDDLPVCGWWPAGLSPLIDRHLAITGDRSLRRWARECGAAGLALDRPVANINTAGDLARLVGPPGVSLSDRPDPSGTTT